MFRSPGDILLRFFGRLHGLLHRERAQTLAEYAILTSFIVVSVTLLAVIAFRTQVAVGYDAVTDCLSGGCLADDRS
jgi:hypothetical protein